MKKPINFIFILIILLMALSFWVVFGFITKDTPPFPDYSPDVSFSNVRLCVREDESCSMDLLDSAFSEDWKEIFVCGDYESSNSTEVTVYWIAEMTKTAFGYENQTIKPGSFNKCFSLYEAIINREENFRGEQLLSPVNLGNLDVGEYIFKIEQGRYIIAEFNFSIQN